MDLISKTFDTEVAKEVDTDSAIILQNIEFWQSKNIANEKHFHEGRHWTYNSIKAFSGLFTYLTEKQIRSCLERLKKKGFLVTSNHNVKGYDRTKWYSSTRLEPILPFGQMDITIQSNGFDQIGEPIPYINTDITSLHKVKMSDIEVSEDKLTLKTKKIEVNVDFKTGTMFHVSNSFRKLFIKNIEDNGAKAGDQHDAKFKPYMDSIRLIIEKDKYSGDDLRSVYEFLNSDTENALFWKKNVLSMSTLRKQMQKLIMAKNTPNRQQRQPDRN